MASPTSCRPLARRARPRSAIAAGALALVALLGASAAHAAETTQTKGATEAPRARVFGSLRTYVRLYEDVSPQDRATKRLRLPFLQMIHAGGHDLGVAGLSVEVMGYGDIDALEPLSGPRGGGDLLLATATWQGLPKRLLFVRLGRQLLHAGVANNAILDGLHLRLSLPGRLIVEGWGGLTAEPGFDQAVDHWQAGARLAWDPADVGRLGVSFAHEARGDEVARQVLGVDLAWRQLPFLDVEAFAHLDLLDVDLRELDVVVAGKLGREVRLHAQYRRFDPAARLPKTSIFSVFSDVRHDEASLAAGVFPLEGALALHASGSVLRYADGELAYRARLRPRWIFSRSAGDLLGLELARVGGRDNGYWSTRAYAAWLPWDRLHLTVDAEHAQYDEAIHDHAWSVVGRLNATFELAPGLRLMGEAAVTVSPDFQQHWQGLLRLGYDLSGRGRSRAVMP